MHFTNFVKKNSVMIIYKLAYARKKRLYTPRVQHHCFVNISIFD